MRLRRHRAVIPNLPVLSASEHQANKLLSIQPLKQAVWDSRRTCVIVYL